MAVELRRASEFSFGELAALFTASYEGYFVPFAIDDTSFAFMVDAFDLDVHKSLVAVDAGMPIGLANLGRRRGRTWLGGVGVLPPNRRAGVGEQLTRALLDRSRAAGAREMVLEVIVENTPAISLYEKLGFVRTRELEVLSLAAAENGAEAREIGVDEALAIIAASRETPEPWQRDDDTIANLARRLPLPQGLAAGAAAAVFRVEAGRVGLLQAAGDPEGLRLLVGALRTRGTVVALNYPAGGPVAEVLRQAGAEVTARQYEMVAPL